MRESIRQREQWLVIGVAASKFLYSRIGGLEGESRVQSRWPFILPTSRTRTGRWCPTWASVAFAWRATAARTCTRPSGWPVQYVLALLSLHLPSPHRSPTAFTFAPAATRARPLKSKAFSTSCPLPSPSPPSSATCSVPTATLLVVRARTPRVVHSRCILTVRPPLHAHYPTHYANGCGHIISTIDAIMTRNSNRTDASSMSPPPSTLKYMARQPRRVIPSIPRFILPTEFRILVEPRQRCTNKQAMPSNCLCPKGSIILRSPLVRSGPSSSFWMDPVSIPRYLNFYRSLFLPSLIFLANREIQCTWNFSEITAELLFLELETERPTFSLSIYLSLITIFLPPLHFFTSILFLLLYILLSEICR